jgi:hypothetical protein
MIRANSFQGRLPIPAQNIFRVGGRITARVKQGYQILQIRDGVNPRRRGLQAEAAVEIGADPSMKRIACQLTDMIKMIDRVFKRNFLFGNRLSSSVFLILTLEFAFYSSSCHPSPEGFFLFQSPFTVGEAKRREGGG